MAVSTSLASPFSTNKAPISFMPKLPAVSPLLLTNHYFRRAIFWSIDGFLVTSLCIASWIFSLFCESAWNVVLPVLTSWTTFGICCPRDGEALLPLVVVDGPVVIFSLTAPKTFDSSYCAKSCDLFWYSSTIFCTTFTQNLFGWKIFKKSFKNTWSGFGS